MKKIIGILLAGALVTSAFAADVSAKVKIDGSLLNYDGNNFSALKVEHKSEGWNPDLSLSINGDRAGASMSFYYAPIPGEITKCEEVGCWNNGETNGWCGHGGKDPLAESNKYNTFAQSYSIWFKPFDILKVTLGAYDVTLNQETIDYDQTEFRSNSQGFALDLNVDAFFATAYFAPGWGKSWFNLPKDKDVALGEFFAKVGYGADFGRIQAGFRLVDLKNMWIGAGYDNTFGSVKMFVNAMAGFDTANNGFTVRGEGFVSTNIDAFGISAFVAGGYCGKANPSGLSGYRVAQPVADKAVLGATLKLTYALGSCTPYIYVKEGNFLADSFAINVKPGVTGNLGGMSWEVAADMSIGSTFTVNVPVILSVSF